MTEPSKPRDLLISGYRVGCRVFKNGKPRSACTSPAMAEGWDDAYQAAACAARPGSES